jgi:RNA polymerase sigma-70 factor (ECF subfamily)
VIVDGPAPDPGSDAALVADLARGDAAAFDELYRRHRGWVVRMAARITGTEADALDVLQDTFLYLLRKAPELDLRARLTTFLFPVVRNLALARRRRLAPDAAGHEPAGEDPPAASPEELVAALGALPPEQRDAVLLRFVDGRSLAAIAAAQGVPLGTVKSRLHQALATLRDDPAARRYFLG